ncbi:YgjP-like metallopeptidase domain-containing protein [Bacterioplanoides sp. SCSIO 12839]|uniref:YgjP-like metallopeptidase domain-containing protein n=1 Tax=Bacterioplanoides sp. SCSIO 12839 TaxID=2829569 RepID=UPI002105E674|nr:YgjP-like metallopeptidase domain-containing protein [Bacterioplanoides sp. SCSIO 12839]UTW47010.1 M48 family metallopeptidase [Bacterioplanoides sp. SCSIO 12839]
MMALKYIQHYPEHLTRQVQQLLDEGALGKALKKRYPQCHAIRSNKALYEYTIELKNRYLRKSAPLSKVEFSDKAPAYNALGLHKRISRAHGGKLVAKKEIHIDNRFREMPEAFLRMIVVHELAHLKELEHNKAFYQLCCHMEPDYHQLEFDLRVWLTWLECSNQACSNQK